jgi:hypothetical protein
VICPQLIPFEQYRWIANSFESRAWEDPRFDQMICELASSGVSVIIVRGAQGPIVVTWKRSLNA